MQIHNPQGPVICSALMELGWKAIHIGAIARPSWKMNLDDKSYRRETGSGACLLLETGQKASHLPYLDAGFRLRPERVSLDVALP